MKLLVQSRTCKSKKLTISNDKINNLQTVAGTFNHNFVKIGNYGCLKQKT